MMTVNSLGIVLFFLALLKTTSGQEGEWDYASARGELDPKHWYLQYENCQGKRQSPVPIDCRHIMSDHTLQPLRFVNYDIPVANLNLHNDGHTLKIDVPESAGLHVRSSSLPASYRLTQFHFHWGTRTQGGSEHRINGKRWPLEMHLVHVDENIPANQTLIDKNGMIVVSVLFDKERASISRHHNQGIEQLASKFPLVEYEGQNFTIPRFVIGELLPQGAGTNYLRYSGSLTTPPCAEVVEWHILTHTMPVSEAVLQRFRDTRQRIHSLNANDNSISAEVVINENDRPLQPLNARPIRLKGHLSDLASCTFQNLH